MSEFRVNTNGERNGWAAAEENQTTAAFRRSVSQSQFQPETRHRLNDETLFGFPSLPSFPSRGFDLQTLESSFGNLSVLDSSVRRHHQLPLPDNRWTNRSPSLHNQVINGGGDGGYLFPPRPLPPREQLQRLPFQNDGVNGGSFGYDPMLNNGFLNGNSRDVPYLSRNRFLDQSLWDSTNGGISNPWRSNVYNLNDQSTTPSVVENHHHPIFSLAKDRASSQQLQEKILEGSKETIDMIFNDVIPHIFDLVNDPFGYQFLQKLMEKCSSEQISQILDMVTENQFRFVNICNDSLGTRVMQSLLRCLDSEDQISRILEITSNVALALTRNTNAKHVILQCFTQFSPVQNRNLLEVITRNCYRIAIDQHGCCMLQQCLSIGCNELKQRLIDEIIANALRLCVNCYGNYVVQYVLELEEPPVTEELIRTLVGNYAYLSRNKYGSHAVQKFLKNKDVDSRLIVKDLLSDIYTLLLDPFGNYVIQTAWFVSQDDIRHILLLHINRCSSLMRCNKFGNKILEKLQLL